MFSDNTNLKKKECLSYSKNANYLVKVVSIDYIICDFEIKRFEFKVRKIKQINLI